MSLETPTGTTTAGRIIYHKNILLPENQGKFMELEGQKVEGNVKYTLLL